MALKEKRQKGEKYPKEFLNKLRYKDFQGRLLPGEILIAQENGILKRDLLRKVRRYLNLNKISIKKLQDRGFEIAPIFQPDGSIKPKFDENGEEIEGIKYFINSHKELVDFEQKQAKRP